MKVFLDTNKIYTILSTLRKFVSVIEIGDIVIDKAISLHSKDFEDSVQYYAAERANMNCIITRNTQDFLQGAIPIYQPHDFLDKFIN